MVKVRKPIEGFEDTYEGLVSKKEAIQIEVQKIVEERTSKIDALIEQVSFEEEIEEEVVAEEQPEAVTPEQTEGVV